MSTAAPAPSLSNVGIFADLTDADRGRLEAEFERRSLKGARFLFGRARRRALYIVVSGRFDVTVDGREEPIAEIGPGSPIGEIAFLAGGLRTATVTAVRDSLVVRLERADFDRLCQSSPRIWGALTAALARRLADQTAGRSARHIMRAADDRRHPGRSRAGAGTLHRGAGGSAGGHRPVVVLRSSNVGSVIGARDLGGGATEALNALEGAHDTVIYVADPLLTDWSEKAMRQADLVLRVGFVPRHADAPVAENVLEAFAARLVGAGQQKLVLLHPRRVGPQGTRHWLAGRQSACIITRRSATGRSRPYRALRHRSRSRPRHVWRRRLLRRAHRSLQGAGREGRYFRHHGRHMRWQRDGGRLCDGARAR